MMILRPKSPNQSCQFWGPTRENVDLGFEAQPRNTRSLSPCAWYRLYMVTPDLLIIQPPSIWPVLDHPRSSALGLLLLPRSSSLSAKSHLSSTHHKTSKHDSPYEPKDKGKTIKMSWIRIEISARQWLITYQTKVLTTWFLNLPLDESIDNKKHKVWISNLRPHEAQLEDQKPTKSSKRSSRRRKSRKTNKIPKKRQTKTKW
jgi:hypothetical protein